MAHSEEHSEPHCFLCGFNHPDILYPEGGGARDLLFEEVDTRQEGLTVHQLFSIEVEYLCRDTRNKTRSDAGDNAGKLPGGARGGRAPRERVR